MNAIDPFWIYKTALTFYKASHVIKVEAQNQIEEGHAKTSDFVAIPFNNKFDVAMMWPMLVYRVFAVELLLKCLLTIENIDIKVNGKHTHSLIKLFNKLPDELKKEVELNFESIEFDPPTVAEVDSMNVSEEEKKMLKGDFVNPNYYKFLPCLEDADLAFQECRYIYEYSQPTVRRIGEIFHALELTITEIKFEWIGIRA